MGSSGALIKTIPYRQEGEPEKHAAILRVDFDLDGLSPEEIQVLGHLVETSDAINPIYRDQIEPRTFVVRRLVRRLMAVSRDGERQKLEDYQTVLDLHNHPFAQLPRKNNLLDLPQETVRALASSAGEEAWRDLEEVHDLLFEGQTLPDKANFYPADLTEDEFVDLGRDVHIAYGVRSLKALAMRRRIPVIAVGAEDGQAIRRRGAVHLEDMWGPVTMTYEPDGGWVLNQENLEPAGDGGRARAVRLAIENNRHGPSEIEWRHNLCGERF